MIDLLPEPKKEVLPYLHHKMGFLDTDDLWIWRGYLNYQRYLRYYTGYSGCSDLHCGLLGDRRNTYDYSQGSLPCDNCFHYPYTVEHGDTSGESSLFSL